MADEEPEVIPPAKFIQELWAKAPADWIVEFNLLQYRPTPEKPDDKRMSALFYPVNRAISDWDAISKQLDHSNRTRVENIHHSVNPRFRQPRKHGTNADVQAYVALWIDVDFNEMEVGIRAQFEQTVDELRSRGLGPSCIIESGRGLHAYWLLDHPYPVSEARPACAGIMDYFKISDAIHDPRRVLRVPGFLNLKNPKDPKFCYISEATWERFTLEAFKEFQVNPAKSDHDKELEEETKNKPATISRDPKIEQIKDGVSESGGPYGGRHLAAVALAGHYCSKLKTKKLALYAMRDWNQKNKPPMPEDEVEKIVDDIWAKEEIKRAEEKDIRKQERKSPKSDGPSDGPPWLDENGSLIPAVLASHIMTSSTFLSTPIGADGRGVTLYVYKEGAYHPGGFDFARREVVKILGKGVRDKHLTEVVELITEFSKKPYEEINRRAKTLINVSNGMLDWKTGELLPHDPKYLSTIQIPVAWDRDAKSDKLDEFLKSVLPEDAVSLFEEFAGHILIPDPSFQKCLVMVGEGGNGKSTALGLLEFLVGPKNISHYSLHNLTEERFAAAGLIGMLANFYDELEQKALESTGLFKQIVGGNPIKAEEKGKAPFSFRPFCRMVFSTNQMPRATDRSQAYFDRFLFIQFDRRIRGSTEEVRHYEQVLASMPGLLSALLARSIAGLQRLAERGRFVAPKSSTDALEEYRRDCNSAYDFLRECCRMDDPNGWLPAPLVYERYKIWSDEGGRKAMSSREFNRTLRGSNVRELRHGTSRGWGGLSWSSDTPQVSAQEQVEAFGQVVDKTPPEQPNLNF
jgi:putative DNA primase/helicase